MNVNIDMNSLKARLLDKIIADGRLRKKHIIQYYELNEITWQESLNTVLLQLDMLEIKKEIAKHINDIPSCKYKENK